MATDSQSPSEILAAAQQRNQETKGRLMNILAMRQEYFRRLEEKYEQQMAEAEAAAAAEQQESSQNWLHAAGTGALVGSAGGPVGTAVGAGLGAFAGIASAHEARKSKDPKASLWDTIKKPAGDKFEWQKDLPIPGIAAATGAVAGASSGKAKGGTPAAPSENISSKDYSGMSNRDIQLENADMEADFASRSAGEFTPDANLYDPSRGF